MTPNKQKKVSTSAAISEALTITIPRLKEENKRLKEAIENILQYFGGEQWEHGRKKAIEQAKAVLA